jgi:hypothetical protein
LHDLRPGILGLEVKRLNAIATFTTCLLLIGCASSVSPEEEVIVLDVAAETVECRGEATQRCLRVRRSGEEAWTNFYDRIEGFTHEDGVRYRLEVLQRRVPDPPADGSSFRYTLLRVLERVPTGG